METTMQQIIPIFHGESYSFWKIKLITILKTRKLWDVVERGIVDTPSTETTPSTPAIIKEREDRLLNDMMALQIIQSAVSETIFPRIASASSSREAWKALEMEFQGSAQVRMINLQTLRREYENLKMEEGETIGDFSTKLINLSNQLRVHGEEKSDYQVVQKVLISMPERFDSIVGVLEQTKDLSILSVTELIGTLKAHERRLNLREDRINEGAFYGEKLDSRGGNKRINKRYEKTNKWCGVCKRDNHNEVDCWRRKNGGVPQMSAKNERKCYVCDKPGHIARDCRLRKSERAHLSQEESEDESEDECHMLFSAVEEKETSKLGDESWLVDSGCTNHMSKDSRYFINLDRSKRTTIHIGNGGQVISEGKGDIQVSTNKGGDHVIKNVLYVPELAKNLLSVSQMISNGYRVIFENKNCIIQDPKRRKIFNIKMKDKSFPLQWKRSSEEAFIAYEGKEDGNIIVRDNKNTEVDKENDDIVRLESTKLELQNINEEEVKRNTYLHASLERRNKALYGRHKVLEEAKEDVMKIHTKQKTGTALVTPKKRQRLDEENSPIKRQKKSIKVVSTSNANTRKKRKDVSKSKKDSNKKVKSNGTDLRNLIVIAQRKIQEKRQHKKIDHEDLDIKKKRIDARLALNKVVATVVFDDHLKYHAELEDLGYTFIHDEVECLKMFN